MAPPRIRKTFSGFAPDLQIDLKRPCKWGANPRRAPTYDFAKMFQKLNEIERIWTGGIHPSRPFRSTNELEDQERGELTYPRREAKYRYTDPQNN